MTTPTATPTTTTTPQRPRGAPLTFPGGERAAFFVALLAALYAAYRALQPLLVMFLIACAIASLTYRPLRWLTRRFGGRRRLAAVTSVAILIVGVLAPLGLLVVVIVQRLVEELGAMTALVRNPAAAADRFGALGPWARRALDQIGPSLADAGPALAQRGAQLVATVGRHVVHGGILLFLFGLALYYLYVDGERWRDRLIRLLPLRDDDVRAFMRQFHRVSVGVLAGNLGTALAQSVLAGLAYWVLGVPMPLVWAALSFVAALIPAVGTAIVWLPIAGWFAATGQWWRAIVLAAYGVGIVGTVDNIVRPILTRTGLRIHPLLAFFAVFGGIASFGVSGLFLGPLAVAFAVALLDAYEARATTPPAET
jgi:predicted PurR-regulated permease PerM